MLVLLGLPSGASAAINSVEFGLPDPARVTVGQTFAVTVTATADSLGYSGTLAAAGINLFTVEAVDRTGAPEDASSGTSSPVVDLDNGEAHTWIYTLRAPTTATAATPPLEFNGDLAPAIPVRPVLVTLSAPSPTVFPGSVSTSNTHVSVGHEASATTGAWDKPVTVEFTGLPVGVTASSTAPLDKDAAAVPVPFTILPTAYASSFPGGGVAPLVALTTIDGTEVSSQVAVSRSLTIAPRPTLSISGLPSTLTVGQSATATVTLSNLSAEVQSGSVSVALTQTGGIAISQPTGGVVSLNAVGGGSASAQVTVTATAPGVGTLKANYAQFGALASQTEVAAQTAVAAAPVIEPTPLPAMTFAFKVGKTNPFKRTGRKFAFSGELKNGSAPLPRGLCSDARLKPQVVWEIKKRGKPAFGAATVTKTPVRIASASNGTCVLRWGSPGLKLPAASFPKGGQVRYTLRLRPKGSVAGYAPLQPSVDIPIGTLKLGR